MKELTQRQEEIRDLYSNGMTDGDIARELGIDHKAVCYQLWQAYKKGGLAISPIPSNFGVDNISVLHDKEGNVKLQWSKASKGSVTIDELKDYYASRLPVSGCKLRPPKSVNTSKMVEAPVFDMHHAMLSWEKETGDNYDTKISRHLQEGACSLLYEHFKSVKRIVYIIGGDSQTADNRNFLTERSGNKVDSDSRYPKMAWTDFEANITCIERAKSFAEEIHVIVLRGNHNETAAVHLAIQIWAYFRNDKQVVVDTSPEPHRFYTWGVSGFMATHGDMSDFNAATYALNQAIKRKLDVERMFVRMGHFHKRGRKFAGALTEEGGVVIERFPTVAAQEAYAVEKGYSSIRAMVGIMWDKKYGRKGGTEISVGEILDAFPL